MTRPPHRIPILSIYLLFKVREQQLICQSVQNTRECSFETSCMAIFREGKRTHTCKISTVANFTIPHNRVQLYAHSALAPFCLWTPARAHTLVHISMCVCVNIQCYRAACRQAGRTSHKDRPGRLTIPTGAPVGATPNHPAYGHRALVFVYVCRDERKQSTLAGVSHFLLSVITRQQKANSIIV